MTLPFKGMAYTPLAIWSGLIAGDAVWPAIMTQFAWGLGLVALSRLVWLRARKRIEIQGG